ncbi:MAG TPA: lmo0937 family membrane protein [Polyangia bacterium]
MGFLTSYTVGGLIHILLLLALVTVLIRVIQGRKVMQ